MLALQILTAPVSAQDAAREFAEKLDSATGDAALRIGQDVHESILYADPERARELMLRAIEASEGRSDHDLHSQVLRGIAVTYAIQNSLDETEKYFYLALDEAQQGEGTEIPRIYLNIGILEQQRENFSQALSRFQQALDETAGNPNPVVESLAHYHIGMQMDSMGLLPMAEDHLRGAIEVEAESQGSHRTPAGFELARVLALQGKFEEVDGLIEKTREEIYVSSPGKYTLGLELRNTSEIALLRGQEDVALEMAVQGRQIFAELNSKDREAQAACVAAKAALGLQRTDEALDHGLACLSIAEDVRYERQRADGASVLSAVYEERGELQNALRYARLASEARNRFLQAQGRQQTEVAIASVEAVFNERAVEAARKNEAEARELANRTRSFLVFVSLATLFAVGLLFALYRVLRQRQKINVELTGLVKEREILLAELNHRVKNNLQVVASLLGLERRRVDPTSDSASSMQSVQARVLSMASMHENLQNTDTIEVVPFKSYLEELAARLTGLYRTDCLVKVEADESYAMYMEKLGPVGLIICELVSNACKHGYEQEEDGEILFGFDRETSGNFRLSVRDNGVGLPEDFDLDKTNSLGLSLVKDLAEQIDATLRFVKNQPGTAWELSIPETAFVRAS